MKFISTKVHGILDYVGGIALIFAPALFGFTDVGGAAETVPYVVGILVLGLAIMTRNEVGLVKLVSMGTHLMLDYGVWLVLALSPWIFGFSDLPSNAWVPHVVVGALFFVVALVTEKRPQSR